MRATLRFVATAYPSCGGTLVMELTERGRRVLRSRLKAAFGDRGRFDPEGEATIEEVMEVHAAELFDPAVPERFAEA